MLFTKPVIFVVISFLGVALIYSSSSTFDVFGEIKKSEIDCIPESGNNIVHCCYKEYDSESGDTVAIYCATCYDNGGSLACDAYDKVYSIKPDDIPPTPPTGGKGIFGSNILPSPSTSPGEEVPNDGGVLQQPTTTPIPTPLPTGPSVFPKDRVAEQLLTTPTPPPLFGRNDANIPLDSGIFGQPTTITTPPPTPPLFGRNDANVFNDGGVAQQPLTPPETPPTPLPTFPPTSADVTPEGGENVIDEDEGTLPPVKNDQNIPLGGVIEEPESEDRQDDDDDGPVPPECPLTGPIPPDCTMKPKFPTN